MMLIIVDITLAHIPNLNSPWSRNDCLAPSTVHSDPDNGPLRASQHTGEDRVLGRPRLHGTAREHHPPGHGGRRDGHAPLQVKRMLLIG